MAAARVTVVSVVLTGLGLAAAAAPGEAPSPPRAREAGQTRGNTTGEAGGAGRDPFARPLAPESPGPVEVPAPGLALSLIHI